MSFKSEAASILGMGSASSSHFLIWSVIGFVSSRMSFLKGDRAKSKMSCKKPLRFCSRPLIEKVKHSHRRHTLCFFFKNLLTDLTGPMKLLNAEAMPLKASMRGLTGARKVLGFRVLGLGV